MATRYSPRTVEKLCNGQSIEGVTSEQLPLLISISHCTGWSADRVGLKMKELFKVVLRAEDIWSFHWRWVLSHDPQTPIASNELSVMRYVLQQHGMTITELGRPLNETTQPITVKFLRKWSPKLNDLRPLCEGFTLLAREQNKLWLKDQKISAYGKLTPVEQAIIGQFGATVELFMRDLMKRWAKAMQHKLRELEPTRPINELGHVNLIMEYLRKFHEYFESRFGLIEPPRTKSGGQAKGSGTVYIRSTGYGAKLLLGLLMADRLHVIERMKREERLRIGYEVLENAALASDSKECGICKEEMDTQTPEGVAEAPLKLVICCGQVVGSKCLWQWFKTRRAAAKPTLTCPICRFHFPTSFVDKISQDKNIADEEDLSNEAHIERAANVEAANEELADNIVDLFSLPPPLPLPRRVEPEDFDLAAYMPAPPRVQPRIILGVTSGNMYSGRRWRLPRAPRSLIPPPERTVTGLAGVVRISRGYPAAYMSGRVEPQNLQPEFDELMEG